MESSEAREKVRGFFLEPATTSPEEFAEIMKNDLASWSRVIRDAKVKID
jgi:tripartite-type tricarboxylate transporter receptor subunit TctC